MKKVFHMGDLRNILSQLNNEEISMSKALEILNEKAEKAERLAFDNGWRLRMSKKGSRLSSAWTEWKSGSSENVG